MWAVGNYITQEPPAKPLKTAKITSVFKAFHLENSTVALLTTCLAKVMQQAEHVMQLQHELAESIPNLGLRILVSKPTARGPRTILLYEQPFCHLSSPDVGDWLVFPAVSAPYIAPWENDSAAAFDTAGRVIGAVFPNQARSRLRIAPWIKASDGFVDELFQGRHGTVHTDEIASYLNHFAPW